MDTLHVADVHPALDGDYEFDVSGFTNFELHAIKKATGLTAGDIGEAYERLDNDVLVGMALITLMRAGKILGRTPWVSQEMDALWAAPVGGISLSQETEADVDPPAPAPTEHDLPGEDAEKNGSSGESSRLDSALHPSDLSLIGDPTLPTSST